MRNIGENYLRKSDLRSKLRDENFGGSVQKGIMKRYTLGSSYSISTVFEAKLMESGKWRSAVANNPDKLSDKAENVSNQLPNQLKAMLALISRNPQITYDQLAKELNISRETVRRHIGKLRDDYKIISRSGSTRGYWIVLKNDI